MRKRFERGRLQPLSSPANVKDNHQYFVERIEHVREFN
jgi:hypothetical protein